MDITIDFEQIFASKDQADALDKAYSEAFKPAEIQVRVGSADLLSGSSSSNTGRCC
jgi:hypothetical protein